MTFNVTILGSSSALPTSQRYPSAHVLNVHERFFLVDCGEGTQMQLRKYRIRFGKINHVFISHMHGDHVFGLYGLITSFNLLGRSAPLYLFGPPALEPLICKHLADYDIAMGYELVFRSMSDEPIELLLQTKQLTVYAYPLKHRIPTWGFLFRENTPLPNIRKDQLDKYGIPYTAIYDIKTGGDYMLEDGRVVSHEDLVIPAVPGRSYAYCSDTSVFRGHASRLRGVDLLYHEATFTQDKKELAQTTGHSTARQAAEVARKAGVKQLLIGHFSARYKNVKTHLEEARAVFPQTQAAEDGMVVSPERKNP